MVETEFNSSDKHIRAHVIYKNTHKPRYPMFSLMNKIVKTRLFIIPLNVQYIFLFENIVCFFFYDKNNYTLMIKTTLYESYIYTTGWAGRVWRPEGPIGLATSGKPNTKRPRGRYVDKC